MKPLIDDLHALRALLEIDQRIVKVQGTIAALDTGAAIAAEYNGKKPDADALRSAAQKAQAGQRDSELKLSSIEEKTKQVNDTLYGGTVRASRELENLQKEIEMLGRQKDSAEVEVLTAMEAAQEAGALADTATAEMNGLAERYRKVRAVYKKRHDELTAEIEALKAPRAAAAAQIERANLLARYDALRAKKGGIGAAVVDAGGACGACHIRLNGLLVEGIVEAREILVCEHCQRLLLPAK